MKQITTIWHLCKDELPKKDGDYLVAFKNQYTGAFSYASVMTYIADKNGGWNCVRFNDGSIHNDHRITNVDAWADTNPLNALFDEKGTKES